MRLLNWFKDVGIRSRMAKVCKVFLYITSGALYGLLIGAYLDKCSIDDYYIILGLSIFLSLLVILYLLGGQDD